MQASLTEAGCFEKEKIMQSASADLSGQTQEISANGS